MAAVKILHGKVTRLVSVPVGELSIAALAIASTYDTSGDFSNKEYLAAAERAFGFFIEE